MAIERKVRYQQARRLSVGMLEQCLKSNEELSKMLNRISTQTNEPQDEQFIHLLTQMVAEFTQVQTLLSVIALSVQELTDELRDARED